MADRDYVKINGSKFPITTEPDVEGSLRVPQALFVAADDGDFWQTWEMRSFQGGERQERIIYKDDLEKMCFDDGEGVDVATFGQLKLQPALTRNLYLSSATMPMIASNDGQTVVLGTTQASALIKTFSGNPGSWTNRTTPGTAAVLDIIAGTGANLYAIQGTRIIESTDTGATWANSTKGRVTSGTASSGNTTTMVLAAGASAVNDYYNGMVIITTGGTGAGQSLTITDYVGSSRTATFATATAVSSDTTYEIFAVLAPRDMTALAFCANRLYAVGPTYVRYYDGTDWVSAATYGGDFAANYGEDVYWAKSNIVYRYNGTAPFETDRLPQGFTITGLFPYRNVLFIPGYFGVQGGKRGAVYYIMDGKEAHLYSQGSYDGTSNYTIAAVAGSDDEVYFATQKRGGADRFDLTVGGLASGPAWAAKGVIPFKSMCYSNGKLFVGRYDTNLTGTAQATGNDTTHIKLAAASSAVDDAYNGMTIAMTAGTGVGQTATISDYVGSTRIATISTVAAAADATTVYFIGDDGVYIANTTIPTTYRATGWLTTSEHDFFFPHNYKLFAQIVMRHKALLVGESIKVEYSLDSGVTYRDAGTSSAVGSVDYSFKIPTARGQSIKLRITLTGPGTSTPCVNFVRVDAAPITEPRWMWDLNLDGWSTEQGRQKLAALEAANDSQSVVEFEDQYKIKHSVIVEFMKIRALNGDKYSIRVFVRLREVL